jgi:hypothetical protein
MPNRQAVRFPTCSLCNEPVEIDTAKFDSDGKPIHEECYILSMVRKYATPPLPPKGEML